MTHPIAASAGELQNHKHAYSRFLHCNHRFFCLFGFLTSSSTTRFISRTGPKTERLTILRAATHETELGDHDFYLSRTHYTDTDPTSRDRTRDRLTRSHALYRLSYRAPPPPPPPQPSLSYTILEILTK